uniref:Tyrosine specific protein phosphatases domain-containing protein n=1 Tax=Periophthalmus magnuspinnatus TaxID=409849 RepID=A0A3B4B8I3_9GOBI
MSVSQVSPGLFLSGLDSALNVAVLTQRKIKLIVNVSGVSGVPGLEVVEVPVQDWPHSDLGQYFDPVSEKIHQNLNQNHNCLVHCTAGRSRSPALVLAFLISLVLETRPFIRINAGFWRQLMDYELRVQNRLHLPPRSLSLFSSSPSSVPHLVLSPSSPPLSLFSPSSSSPHWDVMITFTLSHL